MKLKTFYLMIVGLLILVTAHFFIDAQLYSGGYTSTKFAPPYDVFEQETPVIFTVSPDDTEVKSGEDLDLTVTVHQDGAWIWKEGYYNFSNNWVKFNFPQRAISGTENWVYETASIHLTIPSSELGRLNSLEHYIVAYSCKKYNNKWKCGCHNATDMNDNQGCVRWMLQLVDVDEDSNGGGSPPGEENQGSGTLEDPYQITTCVELQDMKSNLTAHYKLMNDIDCSETSTWNGYVQQATQYYKGFEPIGSTGNEFLGVLDGNKKTISNLYIKRIPDSNIGLFGVTGSNSVIKDLRLVNANIYGGSVVGALVGDAMVTKIQRVSVVGGKVYSEPAGLAAGGLVAYLSGGGEIKDCYTNTFVYGSTLTGGLVGGLLNSVNNDNQIINSYSISKIWSMGSTPRVGGLVGVQDDPVINSFAVPTFTLSNTRTLDPGMLIYTKSSNSVSGSFAYQSINNGNCFGNLVGADNNGCTIISNINYFKNKTNAPMNQWDFVSVWDINPSLNEGYPILR